MDGERVVSTSLENGEKIGSIKGAVRAVREVR